MYVLTNVYTPKTHVRERTRKASVRVQLPPPPPFLRGFQPRASLWPSALIASRTSRSDAATKDVGRGSPRGSFCTQSDKMRKARRQARINGALQARAPAFHQWSGRFERP